VGVTGCRARGRGGSQPAPSASTGTIRQVILASQRKGPHMVVGRPPRTDISQW